MSVLPCPAPLSNYQLILLPSCHQHFLLTYSLCSLSRVVLFFWHSFQNSQSSLGKVLFFLVLFFPFHALPLNYYAIFVTFFSSLSLSPSKQSFITQIKISLFFMYSYNSLERTKQYSCLCGLVRKDLSLPFMTVVSDPLLN